MNSVSATATHAQQEDLPSIGLASNVIDCLSVGEGVASEAVGHVNLTWRGEAERARLILTVYGAEAQHTIKLNGQAVAQVSVWPDGEACRGEGAIVYLDVSVEAVRQGDNEIEITNDLQTNDVWSAAKMRLEVQGRITPDAPPDESGAIRSPNVVMTFTFQFSNTYDTPDTTQEARARIPDGYSAGTPTPLVIALHGRNGDMFYGEEQFGAAAQSKGWLLISPQQHGRWPTAPSPPGAFAYASLEAQYDIIGALRYMLAHYNVKTDQIYLAGNSMGSQLGAIAGAKFPHIFAAVFDNKGPTDMVTWYDEQVAFYGGNVNKPQVVAMREECYVGSPLSPTPAFPSSSHGNPSNPFCYQRRSGVNFANNYIHKPISITHSISDTLVPIHHSYDLRNAINSNSPDQTAAVYADPFALGCSPTDYHCFEPNPLAVLNFLSAFTLNNTPAHIDITTDESKPFYWMNIDQISGDRWSQVDVSYSQVNSTITATISDTSALNLGFNLGSTPATDVISVPGMSLPATTYLVKGGGNNTLRVYSSGYLTTALTAGQYNLTLSAIDVNALANPVTITANGVSTTTISISVRDRLNNAAPNGTPVQLSTTRGTFPNGNATINIASSAGSASTVLTSSSIGGLAQVSATVSTVSDSATVLMTGSSFDLYLPLIQKG